MTDALARLTASLADRYRLERALGTGGMATVYLAEDLKHHRKVAIKVLKPELAAVLGAERFVQEIQTTAALSHPHILPLFDSGEAGGFLYYVMPYIEGETIREKLNRETQLGVDEAVRIASEVADALDYAHRHGVIHRDIKPENILLHDGRPMVMDFGIALAVSAAAGGRMTETGLSLGTPHYMSPEQATADKDITARSDIYSLASVLYEMLAGHPPHEGSSAQQVIMRIITDTPRPLDQLRRTVPPYLSAAVMQALEKLPADRYSSARAFAEALHGGGGETLARTGRSAGLKPTTTAHLLRHPLVAGLAAALVLALGLAVYGLTAGRSGSAEAVVRFPVDLPPSQRVAALGAGSTVAVSADGSMAGFILVDESGVPYVHVQQLAEGVARMVAGTDGAQTLCFSPDGRWVAYLRGLEVWRVSVEGGAPVRVGASTITVYGMAWTEGNEIIVASARALSALPVGGGEARILAEPDTAAGETYFSNPVVLPDQKTVLFSIQNPGGLTNASLGAVPVRGGQPTRFDVSAMMPLGYVNGAVVLVTPAGALTAAPVDLASGRLTGEPVALGATVLSSIAGGTSAAALSPGGTLVYQASNTEGTLGWVDARGRYQALLDTPQRYAHPRLSPDGQRIVYAVGVGPRSDIWVSDTSGAAATRLTSTGLFNDRPEWSPTGDRILYRSEQGSSRIAWQPADLSGMAEPLLEGGGHDYFEAVLSPDGARVAYQIDDGGTGQADLLSRSVGGDTTQRSIASTGAVEITPRISPDGRWIAYVSDERGPWQVFVQPFPEPGRPVQVSVSSGQEPVWSRDGRRLYYRDGRYLVAASFTTGAGFSVTGRTQLFPDTYAPAEAPHANYDVAPDGRFLMVKGTNEAKLFIVHGWLEELRAQLRQAGSRE